MPAHANDGRKGRAQDHKRHDRDHEQERLPATTPREARGGGQVRAQNNHRKRNKEQALVSAKSNDAGACERAGANATPRCRPRRDHVQEGRHVARRKRRRERGAPAAPIMGELAPILWMLLNMVIAGAAGLLLGSCTTNRATMSKTRADVRECPALCDLHATCHVCLGARRLTHR